MAEAAARKTDAQPAAKSGGKAAPKAKDPARADGPLADALNEGRAAKAPQKGPSILGIEVEVQFVIGHATVSVGTLMDMAKAHVLAMDRAPGDPVDVMVNGTCIAQGELVGEGSDTGEGNADLGVRITRICAGEAEGSHDG